MRILLTVLVLVLSISGALAQEFALSAPDEVGMRDSISVEWTAPQAKGGIIEIRPLGEKARRASYAYTIKNPQAIEAPEAPGKYVLVLKFEGEDRVSRPLQVNPASATLSAAPTTAAGAQLEVTWDGPNNRSDLVTFAQRNGPPIRGAGYAYVGNSKDGTVRLRAPQDAATYDIVYVSGKTILARIPIQVGAISATLDFPAEVPAGSRVAVAFKGPLNAGDRITFARRDGDTIRPASYAYVANAKDGGNAARLREERSLRHRLSFGRQDHRSLAYRNNVGRDEHFRRGRNSRPSGFPGELGG